MLGDSAVHSIVNCSELFSALSASHRQRSGRPPIRRDCNTDFEIGGMLWHVSLFSPVASLADEVEVRPPNRHSSPGQKEMAVRPKLITLIDRNCRSPMSLFSTCGNSTSTAVEDVMICAAV